jgi:hypothetical protein
MRDLKKAVTKFTAQTKVILRKARQVGEMSRIIEAPNLYVACRVLKVGR